MITFENRVVAFLDILGFKGLVNIAALSEKELNELSKLVSLLESAVPLLNSTVPDTVPRHLIPKHNYISDCIILSAPISDKERDDYNGLETVIMRVIQLTHFFLSAGYLIRGGISVGSLWHTDSNVVGPAYQEALALEACCEEPMVVLSSSAQAIPRWSSRTCLNYGDKVFVNGLHDFYIPENDTHGVIQETYSKYEKIVTDNLDKDLPKGAIKKWLWFREYLESESKEGMKWAVA
jgi:hypothetical protein